MDPTFHLCQCPVCDKEFSDTEIEEHVNRCLFLNCESDTTGKRLSNELPSHRAKRQKIPSSEGSSSQENPSYQSGISSAVTANYSGNVPLPERMRPKDLSSFVGQEHILGSDKALRTLLGNSEIPNMILWGPPGCGKTSLANVIANQCKANSSQRFIKLSGTMDGVDKVRDVVRIAKSETALLKKQTILFVDEIHRFSKLQQDVFLPHVENGTITLIGATTENPSFSLNNSLLSRCTVYVMKKLETKDVVVIVNKTLLSLGVAVIKPEQHGIKINPPQRAAMDEACVLWISEMCDGDARVALNSVQILQTLLQKQKEANPRSTGIVSLTLDEVKECIERSHVLYDKKGDEYYTIMSALHKSIRASHENAVLYWLARMLAGGEDPVVIARRLVRAASEDIGSADPSALPLAVSVMHGCKQLGMPESDVLLAQCAVHLARLPKSTAVHRALKNAQALIQNQKGPHPPVPLHLRNAPTQLMQDLGYGEGYNPAHKDVSFLEYMPEGLEHVKFFE